MCEYTVNILLLLLLSILIQSNYTYKHMLCMQCYGVIPHKNCDVKKDDLHNVAASSSFFVFVSKVAAAAS